MTRPPPRRSVLVTVLATVLVLLVSSWTIGAATATARADGADRSASRAARAAAVTADVSRSVVRAGGKVVVKGRVAGASRAPVALQTRVADGWRTLTTGRTDAGGRYRLRLPTTWYHTHTLRVRATEGGQSRTSRTRTVRVRPSYRPAGDRSDHELALDDFRWDPCTPITWRFRKTGQFDTARAG